MSGKRDDFFAAVPLRFVDALRADEIDAVHYLLGCYLAAECYERRNTSGGIAVVRIADLVGLFNIPKLLDVTVETIRRRLRELEPEWIEIDTRRGPQAAWRIKLAGLAVSDGIPPDSHRISTVEAPAEWKLISTESSTGGPAPDAANPDGESDSAPAESPPEIPLSRSQARDIRNETKREEKRTPQAGEGGTCDQVVGPVRGEASRSSPSYYDKSSPADLALIERLGREVFGAP